jgi:hypothetical protein
MPRSPRSAPGQQRRPHPAKRGLRPRGQRAGRGLRRGELPKRGGRLRQPPARPGALRRGVADVGRPRDQAGERPTRRSPARTTPRPPRGRSPPRLGATRTRSSACSPSPITSAGPAGATAAWPARSATRGSACWGRSTRCARPGRPTWSPPRGSTGPTTSPGGSPTARAPGRPADRRGPRLRQERLLVGELLRLRVRAGAAPLRRDRRDLRRLGLHPVDHGLGRAPGVDGYEAWVWNTWGTCGSLISDYSGTPANAYGSWVRAHYLTLRGPGGPLRPVSPGGATGPRAVRATLGPIRYKVLSGRIYRRRRRLWRLWATDGHRLEVKAAPAPALRRHGQGHGHRAARLAAGTPPAGDRACRQRQPPEGNAGIRVYDWRAHRWRRLARRRATKRDRRLHRTWTANPRRLTSRRGHVLVRLTLKARRRCRLRIDSIHFAVTSRP